MASLIDLRVWVDNSSTAFVLAAVVAFLNPPPRMSSHWLTMVRSTGETVDWFEEWSWCLARDMMELSMPDLEDVAVTPPPRVATTDEADMAEEAEPCAPDAEKSKSACLPVEMKKRAENAMARLTNLFLNCSLLDILLPRILCDILVNVDRTLPRMLFGPLILSLLLLSALLLVIDNIVVDGDGER